MKHFTLLPMLLTTLLVAASCAGSDESVSEVTPGKAEDQQNAVAEVSANQVEVESRVVLQGLIAFVENAGADDAATVDALLVNTGNAPGEVMASAIPAVLDSQLASTFYLPVHTPFIAVESGEVLDASCFSTVSSHPFVLHWDKSANGEILTLPVIHRLCDTIPCGNLTLKVGTKPLRSTNVNLDALIDASDFGAAQAGFFKLDANYQNKLNAELSISHGSRVEAEIIDCTASFGTQSLTDGEETACQATGESSRFAEQVAVYGNGSIHIESDRGTCEIVATERGIAPRVWIFNVHPGSYADGAVATPHHEAFYWFYDLAATPLTSVGKEFPRPCLIQSASDQDGSCGGDPKCPQPLMSR